MSYERIYWRNGEEGGTPMSSENLDKMDAEIYNLSNQFGDIDTALDEIIKIQEELIGGDS
jgi:hypothetical protein